MNRSTPVHVYLIAFPFACLISGVLALLVLQAVDMTLHLGPGTEAWIWISSWLLGTVLLTVKLGAASRIKPSILPAPTERTPQDPTDGDEATDSVQNRRSSKGWPVIVVVACLSVAAAVFYVWQMVSFWSNQ